MMTDIRSVKDTLKQSLKKSTVSTTLTQLEDSNKENNFNNSNISERFDRIEVGLDKEKIHKEKPIFIAKRRD
jgi:hypothetical protein